MKNASSVGRVLLMVGALFLAGIGLAAADKVPATVDLGARIEATSSTEKGVLFQDGTTTSGGWECFPYSYDW